MMKALWLFGLSISLGQAVNVHVDVKVGQGSGAPVGVKVRQGSGGPDWQYPDWEGYPCQLEGQSETCAGYVKTDKVWGESQNCDKIDSLSHIVGSPSGNLDDFGYFVEKC